jgi:hypothetical protein
MPRYRIEITATARGQLRRASAWWQEHRPENPELIEDEFAESIIALKSAPLVGAPQDLHEGFGEGAARRRSGRGRPGTADAERGAKVKRP